MTKVISLYSRSGDANDLTEIYHLMDNHEGWSWYEPRPESLIDANKEPPLAPLLRKGKPDIPKQIRFSELMLFQPKEGVTVIPQANGYQYFHWTETEKEGYEEIGNCRKETAPVILRNMDTLQKQFNIRLESKDNPPGFLQLTQYHHNDQCIAWTVTE